MLSFPEAQRKNVMIIKELIYPYDENEIIKLRAGEKVYITGILYIVRDAAHKRMVEEYKASGKFPFDIEGQGIYYSGPAPAKPGSVIGPAGPTTSVRMDAYTPFLLDRKLKIMIGKGDRGEEVQHSIIKNKCVYLGVTGGVAALISKKIKKQEIIAYNELGAEAIRKIYVEEFPAIVIIDSDGNNLYVSGKEKYKNCEV